MDIAIHGFERSETSQIDGHARPRLEKLEAVLAQPAGTRCEVHGRHTPNPERACRVQISMHVRGRTLRAEVKGPNVLRAIDAAIEKMERQIDRFKGRYRRNRRAKKEAYASMPVSTEVVDETDLEMWDERGFVVREKEFKVAALPVAEAVEAMEQLEHDFHVFLNEETGDLNVVYRRQSGNYGLLKPQKGGV
jgi:putative sigma-54 modulation protein